jgi:peptidoglycan hydrolase CwlO-like protein
VRANRGRSAGRARRLAGVLLAVAMLAALGPGAGADTKSDLEHAKARLAELETQIDAQRSRLAVLQQQAAAQRARLEAIQTELNRMAARIDRAQGRYEQTRQQIHDILAQLREARARYEDLRGRLNERARAAYEQGPAGGLDLILGSTSLADLSDRVAFVDELSQSDAELANRVQNRANQLGDRRDELQILQAKQAAQLADLQGQQAALDKKFAEQKSVYDSLAAQSAEAAGIANQLSSDESEVSSLVGKLQNQLRAEELAAAQEAQRRAAEARRQARQDANNAQNDPGGGGSNTGGGTDPGSGTGGSGSGSSGANPLGTCPVSGPHAYGDSFGAPRYGGGFHPHAGVDLMSPRGTPVVAPFSGTFRQDYNGLGGNSFFVTGSSGYVYGAHLDHYARSDGSVSTGTVLGYVGDSGDARGGPTHLHFEWHPNVIPSHPYRSVYGYTVIGSAIDPYPFLTQVC